MDTNKILQTDYLDILFDGRNKAYGSYQLRAQYASRTRRAGMIVLLAMLLVSGGFYVANALKPAAPPPLALGREVIIAPPPVIDPPPPPPDPPIAPPPPPPPPAPTVIFTAPVIAEDNDVQEDEKPAEVKDLLNAQPGDADIEGDPNNHDIRPLDTRPPGTGIVSPPAENTVREYVEQMPEFPGNVNEYLGKNIIYPHQARENAIQGRVVVRFVVAEDGSVSNVEIVRGQGGGLDQEAVRVIKGMPKWKPGKQQGKPVKVYYTLPISFKLQ